MTPLLARLSRTLVKTSVHRPGLTVGLVVLIALLSGIYAVAHFSVRTDLDALISPDLPWRKIEARLEQAFPSQGEDLTVLVEAKTPEQAEVGAQALATALAKRTDVFALVRRQDGGDYFARQALLFESQEEVQRATSRLIAAQPFIGPLVADPSLRGMADTVATAVSGAGEDPQKNQDLASILDEIEHAGRANLGGKPTTLSWLHLVDGQSGDPSDLRRIVQLTPRLTADHDDAGAAPIQAVKAAWATIGPDGAGSHIRITGSVAMESDELKTLGEATGFMAFASLAAMATVLFLAVRSVRLVAVMVGTVALGLVITTALGLLIFGRFTLISVAFLPLFAGLGIDFTVQFGMRARLEQEGETIDGGALTATGSKAGPGILLATASVAAGFFAFWPTPYRGVSELGLIAGIGMGVAALMTFTLFPAAIALAGKSIPSHPFKTGRFDIETTARPRSAWGLAVLIALALACAVSLLNLPHLRFDFDPLTLRDPKSESVAGFHDLAKNVDTTPYTMEILAPSAGAAQALQARLRAAPDVGRAISAVDLVPPDQAGKLPLIADAKSLLEFSLDPIDTPPPPSDAEIVAALQRSATALTEAAQRPGPATASETRMAALFTDLAATNATQRDAVGKALTQSIPAAAAVLRKVLDPMAVTVDTLPPEVRRDWIAPDGQWRIEAYPKTASADERVLAPFVRAVSTIAPTATGTPATVIQAGTTVLQAFIEAASISAIVIALLVGGVLRSFRSALMTILPIVLTLTLTLGTCAIFGQAVNLENMIALPLLLGLAASFNIYVVIAWRDGAGATVKQNLNRAIFYSGLTTATAFAALILSAHPGTASLGRLLSIALFWTLVTALLILPAILARFKPTAA